MISDEELGRYLAWREAEWAARVQDVISAMTVRERALVREVAVMANVLAMQRYAPLGERPERDGEVLHTAIAGCLTMPDIYRTIDRLGAIAHRRRIRAANQ